VERKVVVIEFSQASVNLEGDPNLFPNPLPHVLQAFHVMLVHLASVSIAILVFERIDRSHLTPHNHRVFLWSQQSRHSF
jgi:hypothetical protein